MKNASNSPLVVWCMCGAFSSLEWAKLWPLSICVLILSVSLCVIIQDVLLNRPQKKHSPSRVQCTLQPFKHRAFSETTVIIPLMTHNNKSVQLYYTLHLGGQRQTLQQMTEPWKHSRPISLRCVAVLLSLQCIDHRDSTDGNNPSEKCTGIDSIVDKPALLYPQVFSPTKKLTCVSKQNIEPQLPTIIYH